MAARIRMIHGEGGTSVPGSQGDAMRDTMTGVASAVGTLLLRSGLIPAGTRTELELMLASSGLRGHQGLHVFLCFKLFSPLFMLIIGLFVTNYFESLRGLKILILPAFFIVGLIMPDWVIGKRRKNYLKRVEQGLPDALDLMVICTESGLGLGSAVVRVAEEMRHSYRELSLEFALTAAIGFVFVRRQLGLRAPMLPVDLFAKPVFALSSATAVCAHCAQVMAMVSLPFFFQYIGGLSPIEIGVLITPWPTMLVIMAPISGRLADRYNTGLLGGLGMAAMCAGLILVLFMPVPIVRWDVAWRLAICGLGFGCFQTPNNRLIIGSAPPNRAGAGSGIVSTSRLLGQTTGSALVALIFGLTHGAGTETVAFGTQVCIGVAACFAGTAMVLSSLRAGWR